MIDINLLPYEQKVSRKMIWVATLFGAACLAILLALCIYAWHLDGQLRSVQKEESQWQAQASKKVDLKLPASSTKPTPADAVSQLLATRLSVFHAWALVDRLLPSDGSVATINYNSDGSMTVQCNVGTFSEIQPFADQLREKGFTNVVMTQANRVDQNNTAGSASLTASKGYQVTLTMTTGFILSTEPKEAQ
ncbi:hypothetical protein E4665_04120 [Sporolactobacillus shoreae]|uniref:PilN domain-containing protein n=1 Tax=Sporolactobacillus shoreae TaxID=1465501 RepID=A0A4Z0GSB5_9BACL|nr:hypothetical protein [Sporolactobacillus shoreae]TGA99518.1 hypothetical protein E4665_04120 [Sporolactobacillus shoreae]